MNNKIKIIIADDNVNLCKDIKLYLEEDNEIEILGIATTDEEEIRLIEELKPELVITDLIRNYQYTGLDIIKKYTNKANSPKFLVMSADVQVDLLRDYENVEDYIFKPFEYDRLIRKIKRIKEDMDIK